MHWKYSILVILASSFGIFADSGCLVDGYTTRDNRVCYKAFATKMYRQDAANRCSLDGGYLASVPSEADDRFLLDLMKNISADRIWLGITCTGSTQFCKNDDGTPFGAYSHFPNGGPVFQGQQNVIKRSDYWTVFQAINSNQSFVCELPAGGICRYGYSFWRGSCYSVSSETANEKDAQDRCSGNNANLASIHSDDENAFILSLLQTKQFGYTQARIGLVAYEISKYNWTDGTPFNYTRIDYLKPEMGDCFAMSLSYRFSATGNWSSVNCLSPMPYVCKTARIYDNHKVQSQLQCNATNVLKGSGEIYSPGYPLPYARSDCLYFIVVEPGKQVEAEFEYLFLADGSTLSFYDDISDGRPISVLNSTLNASPVIQSTYNQLTLIFNYDSDIAQANRMWKMAYRPVTSSKVGKKK